MLLQKGTIFTFGQDRVEAAMENPSTTTTDADAAIAQPLRFRQYLLTAIEEQLKKRG